MVHGRRCWRAAGGTSGWRTRRQSSSSSRVLGLGGPDEPAAPRLRPGPFVEPPLDGTEHPAERTRHLAPRRARAALRAAPGQRARIEVFGTDYPTPDGSCIRDFIHVSDLAQAHRAALAYLRDGGPSVTLNCGYGRGYTVIETIEAVRRVSGRQFAVQYGQRRPGDIMTMIADTTRIRNTLDWTPQFDDLDTIAAHALAWETRLMRERENQQAEQASA